MTEPFQFQFGHDWISMHFPFWEKLILPHTKSIRRVLEIGCYEGRASVWFLQRIPNIYLVAIDNFEGDEDLKQNKIDFSETKKRWEHNVSPWAKRTELMVGNSDKQIQELIARGETFDLILVDGDHSAPSCLTDLVLSWQALRPKGFMIIDDYGWGNGRPALDTPEPAVEAFLRIFARQIEMIHMDYQVIIRKK